MKRCTKCEETKSLSEFGNNKRMKDGLTNHCKVCTKAYNQSPQRKLTMKKSVRSLKNKIRQRKYSQSERGKKTKKIWRQSKPGKKSMAQETTRYRKENPKKKKAHDAVNLAVRSGKLPHITTQTCQDCEAQATDYHHESYIKENWLQVIPLCRQCHVNRHM